MARNDLAALYDEAPSTGGSRREDLAALYDAPAQARLGMGDVQAAPSAKVGKPRGPIEAEGMAGWLKGATLGDLWRSIGPGSMRWKAPPSVPREPGETDREYAARSAHADFKWMASPEGIEQSAAMAGISMPGASLNRPPNARLAGMAESAAVRATNADRTAFRRAFKGSEEARHRLGRFMLDQEEMKLRSPQAIKESAREIQGNLGPEIGNLATKADTAGARVDLASAVADAKSSRAVDVLKRNTVTRASYDQIVGMLDDQLSQHGGQVPPSVAHDVRMQLDDLAGWDKTAPAAVQRAWRSARRAIDTHLDKAMEAAGLAGEWSKANANFSAARKLSNPRTSKGLADIGAERREGNRLLSPSEKASAVAGLATAAVVDPLTGALLPAGTMALNRLAMPVAARSLDFASRHLTPGLPSAATGAAGAGTGLTILQRAAALDHAIRSRALALGEEEDER